MATELYSYASELFHYCNVTPQIQRVHNIKGKFSDSKSFLPRNFHSVQQCITG